MRSTFYWSVLFTLNYGKDIYINITGVDQTCQNSSQDCENIERFYNSLCIDYPVESCISGKHVHEQYIPLNTTFI